jgi:hypothetical protein
MVDGILQSGLRRGRLLAAARVREGLWMNQRTTWTIEMNVHVRDRL